MTTPNAMPKRTNNNIATQILSALIDKKPVSWTRKTIDKVATTDERNPVIIETKVSGFELPHTAREEVRVKNVRRDKYGVWHHDLVPVEVRVPTLASNVSDLNVERAARKLAV